MKKYLVSGIAGSGKSSVCKQLITMGHEAYGIEDLDGMFAMYRKDTREPFIDFDNSDPEKIHNSEWLCDVNKLKELISSQHNEVAFYCGVASNMDDIIPLFDKFILLQASSENIHSRLTTREGTEDMGNTETSRQVVLGWKDWWEREMVDKGAVVVPADGDIEAVTKAVIEAAG